MRRTWVVLGVLALAGCGSVGAAPEQGAAGSWRELPSSPLSAREAAVGLWTGTEVLIIGGSDEPPCPPNADCPLDPTPLADGAAVDPRTGAWRRIADSPVAFAKADGVVVGRIAYLQPVDGKELLAYHLDGDRWQRLPVPFSPDSWYRLVAAGDRLVVYPASDENGTGQDYALDPKTSAWTPLPADPLGLSFDRTMVYTGARLVLFDHELVPNPGAKRPAVTRAAAYDPVSRRWSRLPDSEILSTDPWLVAGGRLVNPTVGSADGGTVGNWGRSYPHGGILDPVTGDWSPLPAAPGGPVRSAGARTASTAVYVDLTGLVLDVPTGSWLRIPDLPGGPVLGAVVVAAGAELLVFAVADRTWVWR
jgi:hypothetical protein